MATTTILQLPQVQSLTGAENLEAVQNGTSVRITAEMLAELVDLIAPTGPTGVVAAAPAAGANNNYNPTGFSAATGFLDLLPPGICNITGLLAGFDGQLLVITNRSTYQVTLNNSNGGSLTANQFRMVADFILPPGDGKSFKYSATIGMWIAL